MIDFSLYPALINLYADYASAVDSADWERWLTFFCEDCIYKIQPRENYERGLPLATLHFISRNMLRDRAYGVKETLYHDPYYQRHVVGLPRIVSQDSKQLSVEANYAVFRTKLNEMTTVFNVGRYIDRVVLTDEGPKFAERLCIYDSEMIPNALIYPI